MSFSESSDDSNWNLDCSEKKKKKKYSDADKTNSANKSWRRRNFREKWLITFSPWLTRSKDDPNLPFCRACQCLLGNNGYRIQRHEKTTKHIRNQEILLNEGEDAVRIRLKDKIRPSKKSALDETENETKFETETSFKPKHSTPMNFNEALEEVECESPYVYTKQEYHVLPPQPLTNYHRQSPPPKKDSFDMFFEAISAAVKRLPPRLGAEVKSRVSQVIAEFELRAICEQEAQERAQQQSVNTIPTVVTVAPVITTGTNVVTTNEGN